MLSAYSLVNRRNLQYQLCDKFDQMTSFRTMKLFEARTWHPKPRRTSEIFGFNRTRPSHPARKVFSGGRSSDQQSHNKMPASSIFKVADQSSQRIPGLSISWN
jgi:hypothetical protein